MCESLTAEAASPRCRLPAHAPAPKAAVPLMSLSPLGESGRLTAGTAVEQLPLARLPPGAGGAAGSRRGALRGAGVEGAGGLPSLSQEVSSRLTVLNL